MNLDLKGMDTIKQTTMQSLSTRYDGFIIDIWGVVHDGIAPYQNVVPTVNNLISKGKQILFLSNAPRPAKVLVKSLTKFGLEIDETMILSSGDLTRYQLTHYSDPFFKNVNKICYHLGAHRNQDILENMAITITENLEEAGFILVTAFMDESEDQNQYDELLQKANQLNLPLLCANPDTKIIHGNSYCYCAGVIALKYKNMGGITHYYGKPHPHIYEMAVEHFKNAGVDKNKIVCIGDTLETDIQGAQTAKMDSALVLTGNMGTLLSENKKSNNEPLDQIFTNRNLIPTWIIKSLAYDDEH